MADLGEFGHRPPRTAAIWPVSRKATGPDAKVDVDVLAALPPGPGTAAIAS